MKLTKYNTVNRTLFASTLTAIALTVSLAGSTSNGGTPTSGAGEPGFYSNNCTPLTESAPTNSWFPVNMQTATPSGSNDGCIWSDEADKFVRWVAPSKGLAVASIKCNGEILQGPENGWLISAIDGCGGTVLACGWLEDTSAPCGCDEKTVYFEVEAGQEIYLRVGAAFESTTTHTPAVKIEHQPSLTTPGDLNDDGIVDGSDLGILFANWGT